ncbi:hypothetical protein Ndes2526B_g02528 [Nannochloris sp. 'desiccata']|nr:putative Uncharacterized protein ycf21 [Chlorella desiccata (nom. nud.)]
MACSTLPSYFPPMGSSIGFVSQHLVLRSPIAWSRPQCSYTALQGLANNHDYAAYTDRSTQWQHLDRPLLWQGSETAALQAGGLPSTLSPPWKVILLSDGSVTRHLQLMTGLPVSVECLEMRRLGNHETLLSECSGNGYNSDGNGIYFNNNLPPAISLLEGPLLQRQVLLHLPEPLNRAFVYAASWWNADTVEEYLKDKDQPIWVSLSRERTEMYREIIDLEYGHSVELEEKFGAKGPFWGRSYLFWHKGRPLTLIYEVFSSELEEFLGAPFMHK